MNTNSLNTEVPIVDVTFLNLNNEHADTTNITSTETALSSQETKALLDRSAIQVINITPNEFKKLILEQKFSNDIHYIVEGSFTFDDHSIELMWNKPANLSMKEYFNLIGAKAIVLPDNLSVTGSLNLSHCETLDALPINLFVGNNLYLNHCISLEVLPDNLKVGKRLHLNYCTNLRSLPKNLSVDSSLELGYCTNFTALPENFSVIDNLNLTGCSCLTTLPENLSVGSSLNLASCTNLTALPENLKVGKSLYLNYCTNLRFLPENLSVASTLDLTGCTNLTTLPENLFVGGNLHLTDCTGITSLPSWTTTLGLCSNGSIRKVYLEDTGLSDDLIDRLSTVEAPGMQFYFSRRAEEINIQFLNLEQAFTFWSKLASFTSEMPNINLGYNQDYELIKFLERLTSTADYKNKTSQHLLAQRVVKFMTTLLTTTDDKILDNSLYLIHNALSSCDDRIILTLDDLETLQLLMNAETMALEKNDPSELRSLGLQMMRLEEVKRIAREHMRTISWVDEIEVELAFQIEVRKHLDLPGATQDMLFRGCANVSSEDITKAVLQIKENCTQDKLESYLANWVPWQKYQRQQNIPSFEELNLRMVKAIDDCIICAEKTNKMVALENCHFDYQALRKAYLENGNNPLTNTPLDWSTVVRLREL